MSKFSKQVLSILMPVAENSKLIVTSENMLQVINRIPLISEHSKNSAMVDKFIA